MSRIKHHSITGRGSKFTPMLAASVDDVKRLQFPLIGTPKLDGIRCITMQPPDAFSGKSRPVTRTLRDIPNEHVRKQLIEHCPPGLDGELMCDGQKFNEIQSSIMRQEGEPDFTFWVFDYLPSWEDGFVDNGTVHGVSMRYVERLKYLETELPPFVKVLPHQVLENLAELDEYEAACLENGHEGVCLRSAHSPYKFGRSTFREHWLLKLKRFNDSEAEILEFDRMYHNGNDVVNDDGPRRRSTHAKNMVPLESLGRVHVRDLGSGEDFWCGSGFTKTQRDELWVNRESLIGRVIKYKYQPHGMKAGKPRLPIFLGFRDQGE